MDTCEQLRTPQLQHALRYIQSQDGAPTINVAEMLLIASRDTSAKDTHNNPNQIYSRPITDELYFMYDLIDNVIGIINDHPDLIDHHLHHACEQLIKETFEPEFQPNEQTALTKEMLQTHIKAKLGGIIDNELTQRIENQICLLDDPALRGLFIKKKINFFDYVNESLELTEDTRDAYQERQSGDKERIMIATAKILSESPNITGSSAKQTLFQTITGLEAEVRNQTEQLTMQNLP